MNQCETDNIWLRFASKSQPGRFFLFNKSTGERKWLPLEKEEIGGKLQGPPPTLSIKKVSSTPAQDRLKRLQHNLKTNQTKIHTPTTSSIAADLKPRTSKENEQKFDPPTSSLAKRLSKYTKKVAKTTSLPNEVVGSTKSTNSITLDSPKKVCISESLNNDVTASKSKQSVLVDSSTETTFQDSKEKVPTANTINENSQNIKDNGSKLNDLGSGIVRKIIELCKTPFNSISKKLTAEKCISKNGEPLGVINTTKFKTTRKTKDKKCLSTLSATTIINQIKDGKKQDVANKALIKSPELNTSNNLNIPSYPRGTANSRLEHLKQSLVSQQTQPCSTANNSDTTSQTSNLFPEQNKADQNKVAPLQIEIKSNIPPCASPNATTNDEVEAMDWQPIVKDEDTIVVKDDERIEKSNSLPTSIVEKSGDPFSQKLSTDDKQTMGDIIDTVNENLLRISAEKHKVSITNKEKWRKQFFYFVVDTNVLLRDLSFIESLSKMTLCDTKGSVLYIPYSVLQELDKLKMRSGAQEGVKTLAIRAIKYLNTKFENNSPNLQAQSAFDEQRRLVNINSADDSILNCCLQVKEHVSNILLLSEDINLRNKAICNNIIVSTKADLLKKRFESKDKS